MPFIHLLGHSFNTAARCQINEACFSWETKLKTRRTKSRRETVKRQNQLTLMVKILEVSQTVLNALIFYLLRRILLCRCVHASVRDDSVLCSEPELLLTPRCASRSQRDLAHTPEKHNGWDRDVWCKLSHFSAGVYHIMRHQTGRNKHSPWYMGGMLFHMHRLTLACSVWQHSGFLQL